MKPSQKQRAAAHAKFATKLTEREQGIVFYDLLRQRLGESMERARLASDRHLRDTCHPLTFSDRDLINVLVGCWVRDVERGVPFKKTEAERAADWAKLEEMRRNAGVKS